MIKILLVEDDIEFAELIVDFLHHRSIACEICDDPFRALVLDLKQYDLVLLDLGLPGMDGLEVCKKMRQKSTIPIIISSARGSVGDKVLGLQIGADDYLPKPYDPDELYARIISIYRRVGGGLEKTLHVKPFEIDKNAHDGLYQGKPLLLTEAEFQVYFALIKHFGSIVSKDQLLAEAYAIQSQCGNSLEMIISKIRLKIAPFSDKKHIVSIRGRGYRLVE